MNGFRPLLGRLTLKPKRPVKFINSYWTQQAASQETEYKFELFMKVALEPANGSQCS